MGRARGRVYSFSSEQLGELLREELSCVVAVERSHYARRESGKEVSNVRRSLMLVAHEVDRLEASVIIDDHESVSAPTINGRLERPGDVNVYEPTWVRWLVQIV
eukprot:3258488-Pleurochrysis_carterae.AAC.2